MSEHRYNRRDTYEKEVYRIWRGCGLKWTQMKRGQGYDNTVHGLYNLIVEVKNSNVYDLTPDEREKKDEIESVGGKYFIVYDEHTALAVADAARGIEKQIPF